MTYLFTFWGKLASSVPHTVESRSSVQSALAQELHTVFTAFTTKMDSESGIEEIRGLLHEEEDLCLFLELVAPLVRTNYESHTQLLEAKIKYWVPQYESFFRALSPGRHVTVVENAHAERVTSMVHFCTLRRYLTYTLFM